MLAVGVLASPVTLLAAEQSCVNVGKRNPRSELDRFKQAPTGFLNDIRNDSTKISGLVSSFVASDPELLDTVKQMIASAGTAQRRAIGMGLASAAAQCANTRPSVAVAISDYVRKMDDSNVGSGFQAMRQVQPVTLPQVTKPKPAQGSALIEGEFGEKLTDPFSEPEIQ
ncbi:hypothetical protein [Bosea sp. ASV33]|uniref:hypothetical protein n=1 Tax=Bosea sp. ASV33 TaxID=2795106 RepID=UPI0018EAEDDD|nr:hypothetical protein [Bosea sp. ASV33]